MNETIRMQLSAYVDGELPDSESELLIRRLSQDAALRGEVAEYLELGRIMRGERSASGIHGLRQRVAAQLDSNVEVDEQTIEQKPAAGRWKPLGGVAVAATVAVAAILGLQQIATDEPDAGAAVADSEEPAPPVEYVVPPDDSELRQYLRMHGESSTAQGANGINARLASFELRDDAEQGSGVDDEALPESLRPELTPDLTVQPAIGEERE
ncbi:MAG: RseA family anti-sigma factor [Pseudomonadota bacterium]